ncbi:MAG: general secretion pathway protein GspD [Burkholderiales bacterium RIFCSPLOWO2_02_FULL_57_36]|nr:MAG: general secretion pathway protein GspD [Burkholderiales bacterium RIFCSPLOWO2_02_FULL_57_36]
MHKIIIALLVLLLASCTTSTPKRETYDLISAEMNKVVAEAQARPAQPDAVADSLLPPLRIEVPAARQPMEPRFSLAFNNLPANQFFMVLVSGTRYSMLVPPEVTGTISANLKDVTVFEALDAIREQYGYDYKVEGTRIYIKPLSMQTRVFQVNYLTGSRTGTSDIRVTSGSVSDASLAPAGTGATPAGGGAGGRSLNSSNISTQSRSDFWGELRSSLEAIVGGGKEGRSVVISPQSGVVVVRAMWNELRDVDAYLKATQLSVGRQVILEAKILEVQLNDSFQSGINWAVFGRGGNHRVAAGRQAPAPGLQPDGSLLGTKFPDGIAATAAGLGNLFGLAFQTSNFAALISFLETQGSVHVLSSPRIATLNNQKAVLKVGSDDFFVTNVSTTTTTGTATTTSPSVTLQPFFSGVALDVTPQIDQDGNIILHIHPSVSSVTTVDKIVNLGTGGSLTLPLASSSVSETDSVVKGRDGHVIAIGGLMRQSTTSDYSGLPGTTNVPVVNTLLGNTNRVGQKRELVILLKPTIVHGDSSWTQNMLDAQRNIQNLDPNSRSGQR